MSREDIFKILNSLSDKKATGLDNYQSKLIKICSPAISESLTYLINRSLGTGKVPSDWKKARVTTIFKKGKKSDPGNYRPISILPVLSKVLERLVHTQLYEYFSNNNFLTSCQSGFRKGHSTETGLLRLTEQIHDDLNNGKLVGLIALDL